MYIMQIKSVLTFIYVNKTSLWVFNLRPNICKFWYNLVTQILNILLIPNNLDLSCKQGYNSRA